MADQAPLSRREMRKRWEAEQQNAPLTRRELRRRAEEEEAKRNAIATGELTLTEAFTIDEDIDGELIPPRPPRADGEPEPSRRSLREALVDRLDEDEIADKRRRGPKYRTIAPPTTAQGVRIVDQATGEIKTLRPQDYEAQSPASTPEQITVEPPKEPVPVPAEDESEPEAPEAPEPDSLEPETAEEQSPAPPDAPAGKPEPEDEVAEEETPPRVSLFEAQTEESEEEAESPAPLSRRSLRQAQGAPEHAGFPEESEPASEAGEHTTPRWLQIVLIIFAVVVLAVLVFLAAQQVRDGDPAALAMSIITLIASPIGA